MKRPRRLGFVALEFDKVECREVVRVQIRDVGYRLMGSCQAYVCRAVLALLVVCATQSAWAQSDAARAETDEAGTVVYFHTEFFPYQVAFEQRAQRRLIREFARQALIVTAQHEFGLSTRDETLGESVPTVGPVVHLALLERHDWKARKWHFKLFRFADDQQTYDTSNLWDREPVWEKTFDQNASIEIFNQFAPTISQATQGDFSDALSKAGLTPRKRTQDALSGVPEDVLDRLNRVDFVEQFQAIRAAHEATDAGGPSAAWLEVLVRAYANLSFLTQHHWTTASEAFATRSFIYAQHLVEISKESERALWHRAYSRALAGIHYQALRDIRTIVNRRTEGENPDATTDEPAWGQLIWRFCLCNRKGVSAIGRRTPELNPWALRLRYFLTSTYRFPDWMIQEFDGIVKACPKSYGVYATLTLPGGDLGVRRTGAFRAPDAFSWGLRDSLANFDELPESVRDLDDDSQREPRGPFAQFPSDAALALRKVGERERGRNASWSMLAALIEEEVFVEAAHWLHVGKDGTDHSQATAAEAWLQLVRGHRYERHIESHLYDTTDPNQVDDFRQTLVDLKFVDPTRKMLPMFWNAWSVPNRSGEPIGQSAANRSERDHSLQAILEYLFYASPMGGAWVPNSPTATEKLVREVKRISPNLEIATRMAVTSAVNPTPEQLREWESDIREDAESFRIIGIFHAQADRPEDAIRCLDRSFELRPNLSTTETLAKLYYQLGEHEKREKTLLRFIDETESFGLEHARAHRELAGGMMFAGEWERAKEHAVAAAETYSAWGLTIAGLVTEGLAQWDEAEHYYRAVSTGYTSSNGHLWFFHCSRTGRGDRTGALLLADRYFQSGRSTAIIRGAFQILRGRKNEALGVLSDSMNERPSFYSGLTAAQLARECGQDELRERLISKLADHADELEKSLPEKPDGDAAILKKWVPAGRAAIKLMRSADASEKAIARIEDVIIALDPLDRSMFAHVIGVELEAIGKSREAELFWRRALVHPGRDEIFSTLAGHRLVEKYGVSRPDERALDARDLWPAPKENEAEKTEPAGSTNNAGRS